MLEGSNIPKTPNVFLVSLLALLGATIAFAGYYFLFFQPPTSVVVLDTPPTATSSLLYFTAVPRNDFNAFPNIHALNVDSGDVVQFTGLENSRSFSSSYFRSRLLSEEFFIGQDANNTLTPFIILDNDWTTIRPLNIQSGYLSHNFSMSLGESYYSFETRLKTATEAASSTIPNIYNPVHWTIAIAARNPDIAPQYITGAVGATWLADTILAYLTPSTLMVQDIQNNQTINQITTESLGLRNFTSTDRFIPLTLPNETISLVMLKRDLGSVIRLQVDPTNPDNTLVTEVLPIEQNGYTYHSLLALSPDTFALAAYHFDTNRPARIETYQLTTAGLQLLRQYDLPEVDATTVMLNYYQTF